jgi:hypothetical protein
MRDRSICPSCFTAPSNRRYPGEHIDRTETAAHRSAWLLLKVSVIEHP